MESHQLSTQQQFLSLKQKLDTIPSGLDSPFQRNPSSTSIRSMSPGDALSVSPPITSSPPKPYGTGVNTPITPSGLRFEKKPLPPSPSVSVSAFSLPSEKQDGRERGNFEHTRGNWGNRIVLTTYPGQANVGMSIPVLSIDLDPFPMDWGNPDPHLRGPSINP